MMGICLGEMPRRIIPPSSGCEESHHYCPVHALVCCLDCHLTDRCNRDDKCPKARIVNHLDLTCYKRRL